MPKYKQITRVDGSRTHAWWVRIARSPIVHSKMFSDGKLGGRKKALSAAIAWRDQCLKSVGPSTSKGGPNRTRGRVFKETRSFVNRAGVRVYWEAWCAWIKLAPNKPAQWSYSIAKHGSGRAKDFAMARLKRAREEQKANYAKLGKRADVA